MVNQRFTSVRSRTIDGGEPSRTRVVPSPVFNAPLAHSAQKPLIRVTAVVALGAAKPPTILIASTVMLLKSIYALFAELSLPISVAVNCHSSNTNPTIHRALIVLAVQLELKRVMGLIFAEIAISPSATAAHREQAE